jgi:hypothetical protein
MSDQNIIILKKETYIKAIENSVGSRIFNSLFVKFSNSGEIKDVLDNGNFSCAFFVSSILSLFKLIDSPHSTVATVQRLLKESPDWRLVDINNIEAGDVIVWKKVTFEDDSQNAHIGFAISGIDAVSTNDKTRVVSRHEIALEKIEEVYRSERI